MRSLFKVGFMKNIHVFHPNGLICKSVVLPICRTDSRETFFCAASATASMQSKRKSPKKSRPQYRLNPVLLTFDEGFPKGLPCPYVKRSASLPRPCGYLVKSCDARAGIRGLTPCLRQLLHALCYLLHPYKSSPRLSLDTGYRKRYLWDFSGLRFASPAYVLAFITTVNRKTSRGDIGDIRRKASPADRLNPSNYGLRLSGNNV